MSVHDFTSGHFGPIAGIQLELLQAPMDPSPRLLEMSDKRPRLWVMLQEHGGRAESRSAAQVPTSQGYRGPHHLSFVPASTEAWGWLAAGTSSQAALLAFEEPILERMRDDGCHTALTQRRLMFSEPTIWSLARLLLQHAQQRSAASTLTGEGLALAISGQLVQSLLPDTGTASAKLPSHRLRQIEAHVIDNLHRPVGLAELASLCKLSPHHFARAFQGSTGQTPARFVLALRAEQARVRVEREREALVDIALDCGFANQAHMTTVFRRLYGITPGALRRQRA